MSDASTIIADNLARIRERIAVAAQRSGRSPQSVRIVAATKYFDVEMTRAAVGAGCFDLGESRPQDLWSKATALADVRIKWHLIGHLQRNKVRKTLPYVALIHSVDSLATLAAIDRIAGELQLVSHVLIEVNTSGDVTKDGVAAGEVERLLANAGALSRVKVDGLMTMAALEGGGSIAQRNFASLRKLRDDLVACCPENVSLHELSMGMSGDFELAVEEGATIVRIGSALFEGVSS